MAVGEPAAGSPPKKQTSVCFLAGGARRKSHILKYQGNVKAQNTCERRANLFFLDNFIWREHSEFLFLEKNNGALVGYSMPHFFDSFTIRKMTKATMTNGPCALLCI